MRSIVNISLPKELVSDLNKAVKMEKYSSKSEFLRELIMERMEEYDLMRRIRKSEAEFRAGKGKLLKSLKDLR